MPTIKLFLPLLLTAITVALPAAAEPQNGQTAAELAAAGEYDKALLAFEARLVEEPESVALLYNAGLMGFLSGQYEKSLKHWASMEELVGDDDLQLKEKLIQVYAKLGQDEEVEKRIDKLHQLRKETEDERYKQRPFFCRDQFEHNEQRYMVFQYFDFPDKSEVLFKAFRLDEDGEIESHIQFWSSPMTNKIAQETGELKEGERLYHIDDYKSDGSKVNVLHTKKRLDYAEFKAYVEAP